MPKSQTLKSLEETASFVESSLKDSIDAYYKVANFLEDLEQSLGDMFNELEDNLGEIEFNDPNWSALLRKVRNSKNKARNFMDGFEDNIEELIQGINGKLNKLDTLYNKDLMM